MRRGGAGAARGSGCNDDTAGVSASLTTVLPATLHPDITTPAGCGGSYRSTKNRTAGLGLRRSDSGLMPEDGASLSL